MPFLGAQMYFTNQKVSPGQSELDSRFVVSQPPIGSSAVSRFLIGWHFQTNVAHGNRGTGNNI